MANDPELIIQVPQNSAVERQLREQPPAGLNADILIQSGPTDADGNLEPAAGGEIVLSVPSPETLSLQADDVRRVVREAGTGTAPVVVVVESAELFTDEDLAPVLAAAARAPRPVILRVIRPSET